MPSTQYPTADLAEAQADRATSAFDEMLAGFEERTRPLMEAAQRVSKPEPFAFDRAAFTPWETAKEVGTQAMGAAGRAASSFFDADALMPWKPRQEPAPIVPTMRPAAGLPAAMPQITAGTGASVGARPMPQAETLGAITEGDPEGFFATAGPYARRVEQETGIPASLALAIAANETGYGQRRYMAGSNNFHGIQAQPGEAGAVPYKDWRPDGAGGQQFYDAAQRSFADPLAGFHGFASFLRDNPRYGPALERYKQTGDAEQLTRDIHAAGYAEDPEWSNKVTSIMRGIPTSTGVGEVVDNRGVGTGQASAQQQAPPQSAYEAGTLTPNQISAATSEGLDYETALAVCGPAAAIAFARKTGRNPTMQEALALAREVGWTVEQGMAGPGSQQRLLERMGVASRMVEGAPDWGTVAADVARGNPVILSTPGHYFVAERYDPESGMFDFGESAAVLKASKGRRWFRPDEIASLGMGDPRAALFMDSPQSPSPSVVAGRTDPNAGAPTPAASPPSAPAGSSPAGAPSELDAARASTNSQQPMMLRGPLSQQPELPADEPYDPRIYDEAPGAREAIPYGPGLEGGVPEQPSVNFVNGGPPPDDGSGQVVEFPPATQTTITQGGPPPDDGSGQVIETQMRPKPAPETAQQDEPLYLDQSMPAPPGWSALVNAAGQVVQWVQDRAQEASSAVYEGLAPIRNAAAELDGPPGYGQVQSFGPGEPDYVAPGGSVIRGMQTPIRPPERPSMPAPIDRRTATPEQIAAHERQVSRAGIQADVAAVPYQAAEGGRQAVMEAARSFADALRSGQQGDSLAAAGNTLWSALQVAGLPWTVAAKTINQMYPEMNIGGIGVGDAATSIDLLRLGIRGINGLSHLGEGALSPDNMARVHDAGAGGVTAAGAAIQGGVQRIRGALDANAERVAAADARAAADGSTMAPMMLGPQPGPQRPQQRTVEWLQEQIDYTRRVIEDARANGEDELAAMAREREVRLQSELVDAQNARRSLEPAIASDVGRRVEDVRAYDEAAQEQRISAGRYPNEVVKPADQADLSGPVSIPTSDPGSRLNAAAGPTAPTNAGPLAQATADLGNAVFGGVAGATVGQAADPYADDETRLRNAAIGFGAGALGFPVAGRMMRPGQGGARMAVGPEGSRPSPRRDPGAPFDAPNRPRNLGDEAVREPALPGMQGDIPYRRPDLPNPSDEPQFPPRSPSERELAYTPRMEGMGDEVLPEMGRGPFVLPPEQRTALPKPVQAELSRADRRRAAMEARGQKPLNPLQWTGEAIKNVGYSSMIGPATATVNVLGNLLEPLWAVPKELTRSVVRGNPREFAEMTLGAWNGFRQSGREMLDAIRARGRYASNPDQPMLSERTVNPIGHAFASATEAGGRLFSGLPDALFGTIARGAGEARRAAQIATDEGLKGPAWKQRVSTLLGEVEQHRAGQLTVFPNEVDDIVKSGQQYADRQTFRDALGTWGKGASKWAGRDVPVIGNFLTPFFTTPWNMNVTLAERTPLGAVMNRQKGFDKAYDATVGSAIIAGLVFGPAAAGKITGSGPDDPQKRQMLQAEGWKPYHTLIGDTYVPNRVFGIYGRLFNVVGDSHDYLAYQKKDAGARDLVTDAGKRVGKLIKEEPYLQGLADILDAFDSAGSGLEYLAGSNLARLVPYAATARTIGTAMDPSERTTDRGKAVPLAEGVSQRVQSSLGQRADLPVAQDVLGQPKENQQQGVWSVLPRLSPKKSEPLVRAYLDAGVDISGPPPEIDGVQLAPPQQRRYQAIMGRELERIAGPVVNGSTWANMPPNVKKQLLETFKATARTLAETAVSTEGGAKFAQDRAKATVDKAMGR